MLKRIIAGVAVAVVLAGAVVAGPLEDGDAAYVGGDHTKAAKLYRLAADQGNAAAQSTLGAMYEEGLGVPKDYSNAINWFRLAADQGHAQAQHYLGVMYGNGQGVPQDLVLAHMWFNLSAAQGHGMAIESRDITAGLMTADQLAEAQRLAREWKPSQDQEGEE